MSPEVENCLLQDFKIADIDMNLLRVIHTIGRVHSLNSGKVAATPSENPYHPNFRLLFSKLQSRCTLTRQYSPKVAHKSRDNEKITTIYCFRMADDERGREWK